MNSRLALIGVATALGAAGCGDDDPDSSRLVVVATTTHVADFVENVGGPRVKLTRLLGAGSDPHDYEPKPSDARALTDAGLVFRSGGEVDEWLGDLVESAGSEPKVVTLIDSVRTVGDDPHWWQDPRNAIRATEAIRATLAEADPAGRGGYASRAAAYARAVRAADRYFARCISRVPPAQRKLVTTHDAFRSLARRYGFQVLGSVIPSRSTQAQASGRDAERLVERMRAAEVRAVFPEREGPTKLARAIAREAGATIGPQLATDSLRRDESYIESLRANARALALGLTGRDSC